MASLAGTASQGDAPNEQGDTPIDTILHRKAQAGRAEHQARAMSLAKALRLTLAKVAEEQLEMSIAVISVRSQTFPGETIDEHLPGSDLLMLLDGPGRARAAAMIDPSMVGSLIQHQTMGKVLRETSPSERPMTPTDAAIVAPFLDELLRRAAPVPEDPVEQKLIEGFTFGAWVEDPRVLSMTLDAPDYELIHIDVDISGGVRQGRILLCMPVGHESANVLQPEGFADDADTSVPNGPSVGLSETVMQLSADLRISLAQLRMPLCEASKLVAGDLLELGSASFETVRVQTLAGRGVGRGALGQVDGVRAVQVVSTVADRLTLTRRANDRSDLDLPDITARQEGPMGSSAPDDLLGTPDMPDGAELAQLDGMPDMSDLSDFTDLPDLPDLSELPDLPDMSDLPDFSDELGLSKIAAG